MSICHFFPIDHRTAIARWPWPSLGGQSAPRGEARRLAANIAKLSELLRRQQPTVFD